MPDLAQKIADLRSARERETQYRAQAEAALELGKAQLKDVEAELAKLGLTPETCEQELAQLEAQLERTVDDIATQTAESIQTCQRILEAAKQAGLR